MEHIKMKTLDYLADAVNRVLRDGETAWHWTWFHVMDSDARLRFDRFLVDSGDELAWRAGTPEYRFGERVRRMAEMERNRRAGKG